MPASLAVEGWSGGARGAIDGDAVVASAKACMPWALHAAQDEVDRVARSAAGVASQHLCPYIQICRGECFLIWFTSGDHDRRPYEEVDRRDGETMVM